MIMESLEVLYAAKSRAESVIEAMRQRIRVIDEIIAENQGTSPARASLTLYRAPGRPTLDGTKLARFKEIVGSLIDNSANGGVTMPEIIEGLAAAGFEANKNYVGSNLSRNFKYLGRSSGLWTFREEDDFPEPDVKEI